MRTILITGASGLIGSALTRTLVSQGHRVHQLARQERPAMAGVRQFRWDPQAGTLDRRCLDGISHIVHLAGAGIADARWTTSRIQELIASRAATARLLLDAVKCSGIHVEAMVSAAGINLYGARTTEHLHAESDPAGTDTIARICVEWENAVDEWASVARVVKLRTPLVLAPTGGGLQRLVGPARYGLGAILGSGLQWMPWVHLDDLVRIQVMALNDTAFSGAYHVNTGNDVTHATFMSTVATIVGKPIILPRLPAFVLRMALGDLSSIILHGSRASNARLLGTGFHFQHPDMEAALRKLLG